MVQNRLKIGHQISRHPLSSGTKERACERANERVRAGECTSKASSVEQANERMVYDLGLYSRYDYWLNETTVLRFTRDTRVLGMKERVFFFNEIT